MVNYYNYYIPLPPHISEDLAHHDILRVKVGKGGIDLPLHFSTI